MKTSSKQINSKQRKPVSQPKPASSRASKSTGKKSARQTASPSKPLFKPKATSTTQHPPVSASAPSKQTRLIELLRSDTGGTLEQMMSLTGWQAHTVRGVLSGVLRKKLGLNVQGTVTEEGQGRVYHIVGSTT